MKILIDARLYGLENAGIGRYVLNLVENLTKIGQENNYVLFLRPKYFNELVLPKNWKKVLIDIPHYSLQEQRRLPSLIHREKPDLVHFPHFNVPLFWPGKHVVTIHDLIKHTSKGMATTTRNPWFYWLKYLGYKVVFDQAVKKATKILVPSQAVKGELLKRYGLSEEKVVVTYEGVDKSFIRRQKTEDRRQKHILEKYKIKKPFVIYTGSLYPHKNVERLIQSIKRINQPPITNYQLPITLIVSCARSVFWERLEERIKRLEAESLVNLVGFVPDGELAVLYKEAEAFVFPTLSEGFGLPGLEAMACGCPVICSDIPVLREVYGQASLYFDPLDIEDIAQKIKEVCSYGLNHRNKIIKISFTQAKRYSWQKMARQTLEVYRQAIIPPQV